MYVLIIIMKMMEHNLAYIVLAIIVYNAKIKRIVILVNLVIILMI